MTKPKPQPYSPRRRPGRQRTPYGEFTCARCRRGVRTIKAWWPDGNICFVCFTTATDTFDHCAQCQQHRMLPGRSLTTGQPICRDCSGITTPLQCDTCGKEARRVRDGNCASCALRTRLNEYLHPDAHPQAQQLIDALTQVSRPLSLVHWLNKNKASAAILIGLGDGSIEYSHEAFDRLPESGTREHIRALLHQHGLLPPRDRFLAAFHSWLERKIATLNDETHKLVVRQYATWKTVRRANQQLAENGSTEGVILTGRQNITVAVQLLNWLTAEDVPLAALPQVELDRWLRQGASTRRRIQPFLHWAAGSGHAPRLQVPRHPSLMTPMPESERLSWIRRCLDDLTIPLRVRAAAMLVLVYAQPAHRIAGLKVADVEIDDNQHSIRFGPVRSPLPHPFSELVLQHIPERHYGTHSTTESIWLFPSRRPGGHISANSLRAQLHLNGLSIDRSRNAALQSLVRQTPAAIVARTLGFSNGAMQRQADAAATAYQRYATRQPISSRGETTWRG